MINPRDAQVAAGGVLKGSVAPATDVNVAWIIWRTEAMSRVTADEGAKPIDDYTIVAKCRLETGPTDAAFEFSIPEAGPLSHEGKYLRIVWEVVTGTESPPSVNKVVDCAMFKVVAPV